MPSVHEAIEDLVRALNAGGYSCAPKDVVPHEAEVRFVPIVDKRYPHKCPRCKGPAYVGLNSVDCKARC